MSGIKQQDKFNFWQDHSLQYLEMAMRTERCERVNNPDGYGSRKGQCGDTIEMFIMVQEGRVISASFEADGCMNTVACSNTVMHLIHDKTIEQCWEITPGDVTGYLKTLPDDEFHCAELAVGAMYLALSDYQERSK